MRPLIPQELVSHNLFTSRVRLSEEFVSRGNFPSESYVKRELSQGLVNVIGKKIEVRRNAESEKFERSIGHGNIQVHEAEIVVFTPEELYKFAEELFKMNGVQLPVERGDIVYPNYPSPLLHFPPEKGQGEWE